MFSQFTYHGIVYSKKNSKQIVINKRTGKPQIISNRKALAMESDIATQLSAQNALKTLKTPFSGDCAVYMIVYQPDKRRRDLDNQATSILDGMVAAGILADDNNEVVTELHIKNGGIDREDPRVEIEVENGSLL